MATYHGTNNNDSLDAGVWDFLGSSNDLLYGYGGSDTLKRGGSSDTLYGGAGNESIVGGNGTDTADYSSSYSILLILPLVRRMWV